MIGSAGQPFAHIFGCSIQPVDLLRSLFRGSGPALFDRAASGRLIGNFVDHSGHLLDFRHSHWILAVASSMAAETQLVFMAISSSACLYHLKNKTQQQFRASKKKSDNCSIDLSLIQWRMVKNMIREFTYPGARSMMRLPLITAVYNHPAGSHCSPAFPLIHCHGDGIPGNR